MSPMFLLRITADKDPVEGIVSGLGALAVETVYIILAVLFGISLFKRGAFYQIIKRAGEENRTDSQAANVIGAAIYFVLAIILLPLVKFLGSKLFGA